ncbi:MAG: FKBP-type peptidyl-prolyl cis-trans isomerase, partial [Candidatus Peribacteraceae bacterium]|nr:FKBP-type peptidyl-prolyl cis-trans isomerase [Candidatus Peribacteraceae bacterium]
GADDKGVEIAPIRTQNHHIVLGSKTLIPGFEDALTGLKKNEEKIFTLTFPEKYHAPELQGKPVTFHATVTQTEEVRIPELTDAFAAQHLGVPTAAAFRTKLKESMVTQEERMERSRREQQLMDEIRKATKVELAPELIDEEVTALLEDFARELKRENRTIQEWLEAAKKKPEEFEKELKEQAAARLTLRLGIRHLIDERKIEVSDEELNQTAASLLASVPEQERKELEPAYATGGRAREQLLWQKKVEKLFEGMLA